MSIAINCAITHEIYITFREISLQIIVPSLILDILF